MQTSVLADPYRSDRSQLPPLSNLVPFRSVQCLTYTPPYGSPGGADRSVQSVNRAREALDIVGEHISQLISNLLCVRVRVTFVISRPVFPSTVGTSSYHTGGGQLCDGTPKTGVDPKASTRYFVDPVKDWKSEHTLAWFWSPLRMMTSEVRSERKVFSATNKLGTQETTVIWDASQSGHVAGPAEGPPGQRESLMRKLTLSDAAASLAQSSTMAVIFANWDAVSLTSCIDNVRTARLNKHDVVEERTEGAMLAKGRRGSGQMLDEGQVAGTVSSIRCSAAK
jgi:hypothetical protein